jgi:ring-1,2-phenylacetyl-CoA epoxidase subunit PaaE
VSATASPVTRTVIPDPDERVPLVAWPTVALLFASFGLAFASTLLGLHGTVPIPVSVALNAIAAYLFFTVSHDAAHHAASSNPVLNRWIGRISTPFFTPEASFSVWRFIHMQHHRFTNHADGSDPDAYTMAGPAWQRPLRWATIDFHYVAFYLRRIGDRPRSEIAEWAIQTLLMLGLLSWAVAGGALVDVLVYVVLPQRLALVWLAFAFDYLPHHGLTLRPSDDRLKTTRNRVGGERWLSPILLYQNYHLVHHLHPLVPFYRYIRVWRRNEEAYLDGNPALSTVRGRPLSADEYRALRELAEHQH